MFIAHPTQQFGPVCKIGYWQFLEKQEGRVQNQKNWKLYVQGKTHIILGYSCLQIEVVSMVQLLCMVEILLPHLTRKY